MKDRLPVWKLIAFFAVFFAAWTLREFFLRQQILVWLGDWPGSVANAATKVLLWTVPALLLARRYRECLRVPYLFRKPFQWWPVLACVLVLLGLNVVSAWIRYGRPVFGLKEHASTLIGTVLLVGITEETVFRGFLLNVLAARTKRAAALAVSTGAFVLIHVPIWITGGVFASPASLIQNCVSVFLLGWLFGEAFLREENLLPPIVLHMAWNLGVLLTGRA